MEVIALVTWLITAGMGLMMFSIWMQGSPEAQVGVLRDTHFRPSHVSAHLFIAAGGLVLWLVYLVTDSVALAWVSFGALLIAAGLGDVLVLRWIRDRRLVPAAPLELGDAPAATVVPLDLAEQRIPLWAVVTHGAFAVATVVLVLVTAINDSV